VAKNYDRLKYFFKIATLNSKYIGDVVFNGLLIVRDKVIKDLGIAKPRVALLGEKALWVEPVIKDMQKRIPENGMELVGVWRPSITAQDVTAELSAIKQAGAHIIRFDACGPIGAVVPKQWGELKIPAAMIGFDCASMNDRNWQSSGGLINYEQHWPRSVMPRSRLRRFLMSRSLRPATDTAPPTAVSATMLTS